MPPIVSCAGSYPPRTVNSAKLRSENGRSGRRSRLLPEPAVKAYVDVIRRRGDLSMCEALSLVSEVFTDQ